MTSTLPVKLSGVKVGDLHSNGTFAWLTNWQDIAPLNTPALSLSLPFGVPSNDAAPFFGGLLPEGIGLERLARELKVPSSDFFALLTEVGADVGGSVTIGEPHPPRPPIKLEGTALDEVLRTAAGYLRSVQAGGGGSAATGVQAKVALTWDETDRSWYMGQGSVPSTHILKSVHTEYSDAIHAEAYMNRVARELGLAGFTAHVESGTERDILVIERYDREVLPDGTITRIHQEDAAQALGLPWGGNDKYENVNARSSLRNIARLLPAPSALSAEPSQLQKLLEITVLNVVAGNTDAHAKNFSLLLPPLKNAFEQPRQQVQLADAYDIVPEALLNIEPHSLSMRIAGQSIHSAITAEHLVSEGRQWGLVNAEQIVSDMLQRIADTVTNIGDTIRAPKRLHEYLHTHCTNLRNGDQVWIESTPQAIVFGRQR